MSEEKQGKTRRLTPHQAIGSATFSRRDLRYSSSSLRGLREVLSAAVRALVDASIQDMAKLLSARLGVALKDVSRASGADAGEYLEAYLSN
jgi:hypothetical protein